MVRLQTFGGAVLLGDEGAPVLGAATQRRPLGLLSVLAVAGDAGMSRDKLVGLLWPEVAPKRARHSLTQALYATRKALGREDLFLASEDVRLNPERIGSDVADLEAALRSGDDAAAVALFRGPFLDGFYLPSAEFEWWLEGQRSRLEASVVAALERLTVAAEEREDWRAASAWLRRWVGIRPSDTAVTLRLMHALTAAGDRAGAIEHAQLHSRVMRQQYEMEPEPEVLELAEELRGAATPGGGALAATRPQAGGVATVAGAARRAALAAAHTPAELARRAMAAAEAARRRDPSGRRRWLLAGAGVLLLAVVATALVLTLRQEPPAPLKPLDQRVVVAPFRVRGADASLGYLRTGMVELLTTRLADDTAARSVDAGAVMAAWRSAGWTGTEDAPRDRLVQLAAQLGAERVISGSVVGTPARAIISAAVIGVPSGQVTGEATVEGPVDSLTVLVDRLAGKLLLVEAGQDDPLAGRTTASLPALRAYLAGMPAYGRGDFAQAATQYQRALRYDTAFALAALHLALAAERLNDTELERAALDRGWQFRDALSARDRAHLEALTGPRYPAPAPAGEALAAWENAARLAPNRAEVWYGFGARLLADGAMAGLDGVADRAATTLQRALALDPGYVQARLLLARVSAGAGAGAGAGALRGVPADSGGVLAPYFRWRGALERGDTAAQRRLALALPSLGPVNLRQLASVSAFEGWRPEDAARALDILQARAGPDQIVDLLLAEHALDLERGRPRAALEITRQLQRLNPATRAHLRLRVLDALFGGGDSTAARSAAEELERTARSRLPAAWSDACALAQWRVARGDTAAGRALLALIRGSPGYQPTPVAGPPSICAALLEASLAVAGSRREARARVAALDSLVLTVPAAGDPATYAHVALARLYRRLGDPAAALAAVRRRPYLAGWPRYEAHALRLEGELARETGDAAGAAFAWRRYLALRASPEPEVQPAVATVQAELTALQSATSLRRPPARALPVKPAAARSSAAPATPIETSPAQPAAATSPGNEPGGEAAPAKPATPPSSPAQEAIQNPGPSSP